MAEKSIKEWGRTKEEKQKRNKTRKKKRTKENIQRKTNLIKDNDENWSQNRCRR